MKKLHLIVAAALLAICSTFALAAPVNVNTADADAIAEALTGVGPAKAAAIIAYREEHGPFKGPEDLLNVKGIGEGTLKQIKDDLLFE